MPLAQERGRSGDRGRGHARARPGAVAARDRRDDVDAGRGDVGLERERVRAPGRATRRTRSGPSWPRSASSRASSTESVSSPPAAAACWARRAPTRSDTVSVRMLAVVDRDRIAGLALGEDDAERAGRDRRLGARAPCSAARAARARARPRGRRRRSPATPQRDPGVPARTGSASASFDAAPKAARSPGHGAGPEHADRDADEAPDTRRRDRDRVGCGAGRGDRAAAEVVAAVAGRDDGDDAGARGAVDGARDEVVGRLDLGLAEREVEHVHAVGHRLVDRARDLGAVAVEAERRASAS